MPATGHEHRMEPLAWTSRRHAGEEEGGYPPRVLFSCTHGVCSRTEVVAPTKHSRKAPAFMAEEQFQQMRAGQYWDEIVGG